MAMIFAKHLHMTVKLFLWGAMLFILLFAIGQSMPASAQTLTPFELRDHPVHLIASYYNAIALQDYELAYGYWRGNAPGGASYRQFAQGFADVQSVQVLARLPVTGGVAAGTSHAEVPVNVLTTRTDGSSQIYAGCFHAVQYNVPVGDAQVIDPNWYLNSASLRSVAAVSFTQAASACSRVRSFPTLFGIDNQNTPLDLLSSYYDAIARHDYSRAYQYWPTGSGQTLAQFIQGFAATDNIGVVTALPFESGVAAGSAYESMPLLLTSTEAGQPQLYVGCITARKSNVPVGDARDPDPNWYLYRTSMHLVSTMDLALQQIWNACPIL